MALTPAQRKAKLEAAKALMNEVETDETATTTTAPAAATGTTTAPAPKTGLASFFPHKSGAPDRPAAAQATPAPTTAAAQAAPVASTAAAAATPVVAQHVTPHAAQTAAGQPSLWETMQSVAKLGFGKTQKG